MFKKVKRLELRERICAVVAVEISCIYLINNLNYCEYMHDFLSILN